MKSEFWKSSVKKQSLTLASLLLLSLTACVNPAEEVKDHVVCCKLADGTFASETSADCKKLGGDQAAEELCGCEEDVCCKNADGTFQTLPASECQNVSSDPDLCLDGDVCCKIDGGFQTLPASKCPAGSLVAADLCLDEDVCCKNDDGTFQTLPASQCDNVSPDPDLCLVVEADVCCKTANGNVTIPASECTDVQPADACLDEEVCCKTPAGYVNVPASECTDGAADPDLCLEEEVCCRIDGMFVTVLETACPAGQLAPADMCIEDLEVCCKIPGGYATMPASQCPAGQVGADFCAEVCCKGELGVELIPAGQCLAPAQPVAADVCARDVCCETISGYETLPQSSCPYAQVSNAILCDPTVCCRDASGATSFVPSSQCPATSTLPDDACRTQETECVKFRAVDMSALPYTTTAGDTLQSITAFYPTYPAQASWSASCLDLPAGAQRAVAGVGYDVTLNFQAAVSSIFILRYHAQPGDDLIIPGANLAATTCGASTYHNITKVDLATPSTTVTIQDIDTDGGSGYSVLLAECIEWARPSAGIR